MNSNWAGSKKDWRFVDWERYYDVFPLVPVDRATEAKLLLLDVALVYYDRTVRNTIIAIKKGDGRIPLNQLMDPNDNNIAHFKTVDEALSAITDSRYIWR